MSTTRLIATIALFVAIGSAHGAAVTITFDKPIFADLPGNDFDTVKIFYPSQTGMSTISANVNAGRFVGKASNLVDVEPEIFIDSVDSVYMYCYDVYHNIAGGDIVVYDIEFGGAKQRTLQFLQAVNNVMNEGSDPASYDPHAWVRPVSGLQGAAIQLGIWESLYDSTANWNLSDGLFYATGIEQETAKWLKRFFAALDPNEQLDPLQTMVFRTDGKQDMITADPPPPTTTVPEPGTLGLLGGALLVLAAIRRRSLRFR